MNYFILLFALFLVLAISPSYGIRTTVQVYVKQSSSDQGENNNVEMVTDIARNGNGDDLVETDTETIPRDRIFPGALGLLIANRSFSTLRPPQSVSIRVTEDDGSGVSKDDGVCSLVIEAPFIIGQDVRVRCLREFNDGLETAWNILAIVTYTAS